MPSLQPTAALRTVAAGDTHIGKREYNEDAILVRRDLELYVLADGAGGEAGGTMASTMATAAIALHFEESQADAASRPTFDSLGLPWPARRLSAAVQRANREINELGQTNERYRGMGTTVMAAFFEPRRSVMHLAWVGDSRCYRFREGHLELLTHDHTLATDVLELAPDISDERALTLPRNVVTRALGMSERVRVSILSLEALPGDRYLLCSDGLTDEVDDEQLAEALAQNNSPEGEVRLLLDVANAAGASDNVAAVVIDCKAGGGARELRRPVPVRGRASRPPGAADEKEPELVFIDYGEEDGASERPSGPPAAERPRSERAAEGDAEATATGTSSSEEESEPRRPKATLDYVDRSVLRVNVNEPSEHPEAEATRDFVKPLPPSARPGGGERDPTRLFFRRCPKCGAAYQGPKDACPNCWEP